LTLPITLSLTNAHNNAIRVAPWSAISHGSKVKIFTLVIVNKKKMKRKRRKTLILMIKMLITVIIAPMSNLFGVKLLQISTQVPAPTKNALNAVKVGTKVMLRINNIVARTIRSTST